MRVPSSTQLKKRLHWPAYDPWTAHASARLIWGCWCGLRRRFSKVSQVANLPRYSTFLEFFGKGTQGGPCECSRPLAERSLRYPSYTNFRDRRWGAGLLIQTNRKTTFDSCVRVTYVIDPPGTFKTTARTAAHSTHYVCYTARTSAHRAQHTALCSSAHATRPRAPHVE